MITLQGKLKSCFTFIRLITSDAHMHSYIDLFIKSVYFMSLDHIVLYLLHCTGVLCLCGSWGCYWSASLVHNDAERYFSGKLTIQTYFWLHSFAFSNFWKINQKLSSIIQVGVIVSIPGPSSGRRPRWRDLGLEFLELTRINYVHYSNAVLHRKMSELLNSKTEIRNRKKSPTLKERVNQNMVKIL